MAVIKKAQNLVSGDEFLSPGSVNGLLNRVAHVVVGEKLVGVETRTPDYNGVTQVGYMALDVDTEVYVPKPVDTSSDLVDRSMTAPPPRPSVSTDRTDDFIKEHTGHVAQIRSEPGYIPNTFPQ